MIESLLWIMEVFHRNRTRSSDFLGGRLRFQLFHRSFLLFNAKFLLRNVTQFDIPTFAVSISDPAISDTPSLRAWSHRAILQGISFALFNPMRPMQPRVPRHLHHTARVEININTLLAPAEPHNRRRTKRQRVELVICPMRIYMRRNAATWRVILQTDLLGRTRLGRWNERLQPVGKLLVWNVRVQPEGLVVECVSIVQ